MKGSGEGKMAEKKQKKSANKQSTPKKTYSAKEVAEAWKNFNPKKPLSYTLAALKVARER